MSILWKQKFSYNIESHKDYTLENYSAVFLSLLLL